MQYKTQHYWFYELARMYFDNQQRDSQNRQRRSKYDECFDRLPESFSYEQFAAVYGYTPDKETGGRKMLSRLKKSGKIEPTDKDTYKKIA